VIDGQWTCPDCTYKLERGADPEQLRRTDSRAGARSAQHAPAKQSQDETLFPAGPYIDRRR